MCNLPVILVTARASRDDIETGYQYAADSYIAKPCPLAKLLKTVDEVLEFKRTSGS